MSDSLKKYIELNRKEMEVYPFDIEQGWKEISGKISPGKSGSVWMKVAAAVTLLLSVSIAYMIYQGNGFSQRQGPSELTEVQMYYKDMIDERMILVQDKIDNEQIIADLEEMDEIFQELSNDLKDNVDNEEVLEAMITSYRLKLEILERILNEIEEENEEVINI